MRRRNLALGQMKQRGGDERETVGYLLQSLKGSLGTSLKPAQASQNKTNSQESKTQDLQKNGQGQCLPEFPGMEEEKVKKGPVSRGPWF